jgi:hypothetical protein
MDELADDRVIGGAFLDEQGKETVGNSKKLVIGGSGMQ